jgi:hypothetical protein
MKRLTGFGFLDGSFLAIDNAFRPTWFHGQTQELIFHLTRSGAILDVGSHSLRKIHNRMIQIGRSAVDAADLVASNIAGGCSARG